MTEPVTEPDWLTMAAQARVARLATRRGDGTVDLVPFVYAWLAEPGPYGRLVSAVDHKPKRHDRLQRLANVTDDDEVTVLVDHYAEDWSALWWVRMRGRATVHEPGSAPAHAAVAALVAKYEQYAARAPHGPVLDIVVTDIKGWSAAPPAR